MIDLGGGEAVAFKVESHNHPSAVEPFQGAATGVGGILRDIVAMGARPIALLDGLRFGAPDHHFDRAVAGIGAYGNSVGVPTVGGEAVFDPAYADNCLVNAMCVGLLPSDRVTRAGARTPGHQLVLYGATTGRDGIGGASVLASQELGEGAAEKRPSVQIGDPFTGKKLIEVSVELVERGLVESLQDCGAAGLASALAEMARDGAGVDVHLDRVPLREELEPWEIMISESQERMVAVVRPGFLEAVEEVCARWELHCTPIGEVTDTGELRAFHSGETLGEIPAHLLTDEAPRYRVEPRPRTPLAPAPDPPPAPARAARLAERPQPRLDLRALRPPGRLADGAPPGPGRRGAAAPALDARARGVTGRPCAGRCPVAAPGGRAGCPGGCPQCRVRRRGAPGPDRLPQLRQPGEAGGRLGARARRSRGWPSRRRRSACRSSPETSRSTTRPTGARSRRRRSSAASASCGTCAPFRADGGRATRSSSPGRIDPAAPLDLEAEARLVEFLWRAAPLLSLAHDVSDGGLPVALAEAALWSGIGADVELPETGTAVIACAPEDLERLGGVPLLAVGVVGGDTVLGFGLDDLGKEYGL